MTKLSLQSSLFLLCVVGQQIAHSDPECKREPFQAIVRRVSCANLNRAHEGLPETSTIGQHIL
jgi:hypothetical protein